MPPAAYRTLLHVYAVDVRLCGQYETIMFYFMVADVSVTAAGILATPTARLAEEKRRLCLK